MYFGGVETTRRRGRLGAVLGAFAQPLVASSAAVVGMGSAGIGFACAGVAIVFFGSNFVPVKRFETHDGIFFQWVLCTGIWFFGFLVQLVLLATDGGSAAAPAANASAAELLAYRPDPYSVKFFPFAMWGGAFWALGNTMAVPVINSIGLSMGMLIWGCTNMLMGWATGAFGLFGTTVDKVDPTLNYTGVALVVAALCIFTFIEPTVGKPRGV